MDLANNFLPSRPASLPAYNLAMPPPQPAMNAPGMVPLNEDYGPGAGTVPPPPSAAQQHLGSLPLPGSSGMPFMGGSFGGAPTLIKQEQPVLMKKG